MISNWPRAAGAALAAVLVFARCEPAPADPSATAANQLLAAQLADAISTRALLREPNTFERDPLAQPFTRSDAGTLAGVVVVNLAARLLFKRAPAVLRDATFAEVLPVGNNMRDLLRKRGR